MPGLTHQSSKNLEDNSAQSGVSYEGPGQEVSEENKISNFCDILAKDVASFVLILESG